MGRPKMDVYARFWSYVDMGQPNECWEWLGGVRNKYGAFYVNYDTVYAHRFAYEATGVKLEGVAHHWCGNKLCCNPAHIDDVQKSQHSSDHNSGQTHCLRGHEFTKENTYNDPSGRRVCLECRRLRQRVWRQVNAEYAN